MGCSTPSTTHFDIPIIIERPQPRQLPEPHPEPMPIFTRPVRVPETIPAKRGWK